MKPDPILCDVMFVHSGDGIGHRSFAASLSVYTYIQIKNRIENKTIQKEEEEEEQPKSSNNCHMCCCIHGESFCEISLVLSLRFAAAIDKSSIKTFTYSLTASSHLPCRLSNWSGGYQGLTFSPDSYVFRTLFSIVFFLRRKKRTEKLISRKIPHASRIFSMEQ